MMWYNYNRGPYHGPYRRRPRFFPWPILFFIFFIGPFWHSMDAIITLLILGLIVTFIMAALHQSSSNSPLPNQRPPQPLYRPPEPTQYYQPSRPPVQPYQPYESGYRAQAAPPVTKPVTATDLPVAEEPVQSYEGYEQPQVQYPEMQPPME